jgi:hypothetical protein
LCADGRLPDVERRLRGRNAARVGDGEEHADEAQIEIGKVSEHGAPPIHRKISMLS